MYVDMRSQWCCLAVAICVICRALGLRSTSLLQQKSHQQLRAQPLFAKDKDKASFLKENARLTTFMRQMEETPPGRRATETEELEAMRWMDVSHADNFYERTLPNMKKRVSAAVAANDMEARIEVEKNFFRLMNIGFDRRLASELPDDKKSPRDFRFAPLQEAARQTAIRLELGKSQEEQMREMRQQRLAERSTIMKLVPQGLHKYIDYLASLKITPKKKEVTKNVGFGAFFCFITWVNQGRSSFMYFIVGHLIILSTLLTRNMPRKEVTPGANKNKKLASWSKNSFRTAAAIITLLTATAAIVASAVMSLLPVPFPGKVKAVMTSSLLSTSYFASFFEVFEEKATNGWRWKKAMEGSAAISSTATNAMGGGSALEEKIGQKISKLADLYDNAYDPEIDDYPPLPKYIDEVEDPEQVIKGGSGELDEDEALEHFQAWSAERKSANRKPIEHAPPETPWVGSKKGMYVTNIPAWLSNAYQKNVLASNNWRDKPTKFVKEYTDVEPIEGPVGFRDKRPQWLQIFGPGVWEEKTSVSRRAAREFGSYRKSMWRIDKKVVVQPCDGVEEE